MNHENAWLTCRCLCLASIWLFTKIMSIRSILDECRFYCRGYTVTECPYGRHFAGIERPYDTPCSGHGLCDQSTYTCQCYEGWTGFDCQHQQCPFGPAWFDDATSNDVAHGLAECSNRGQCDRFYGICKCDPDFEGAACERMVCPNGCQGRGECLTLAEIADRYGQTYVVFSNVVGENFSS